MKGFTLIEILFSVALLAILVTFNLPLVLDFYKSQQLDSNTQDIIQNLRRAQLKAMSVEDAASFGVYFDNNDYTLFKGGSFATRDLQYDEVFNFPQIIAVNDVPKEIVFSKFEGLPSMTGNIVIISDGESKVISINEIGRISLE